MSLINYWICKITIIKTCKPLTRNLPATHNQEEKRKEEKRKDISAKGKEKQNRARDIRAVYDHYRESHPRSHPKPKSNSTEWRKIKARLAEGYSVDDLKTAIDGCHKSPYHCGENSAGKTYQSLELIVRDSSHVQQFIELADPTPKPVLSEKSQRTIRATESFLERHGASGNGQS